jgi:deoxyribodipyrimidine photo-lyase
VNASYNFDYEKKHTKLITYDEDSLLVGGRTSALERLKQVKHFKEYDSTRNDLTQNTTMLSAYLKYGCVSVREVYSVMLKQFSKSHPLIRQLVWRDFYIHLLDAFPRVLKGKSLKEKYDAIKWENNRSLFNAWKRGETGYPIVDANMRMLNKVGYMHNRGRLIVASFLVKTLLVDWRWGEKYFAQQLIDYDPAANNGNWQWVSGSGADSQPYFRIFNPWSQSAKHDVDAEFIKEWIPELETVEPKHIHQWDKWCEDERYKGIKYPDPIVDYSAMRNKTLALYKRYL